MKFFFLMIQLATILAIYFMHLAEAWMVQGYGLNPFIAIPAGMVLLAAPYWVKLK